MKRMAPLLLVAGLASTAHAAPAAEASQPTVAPPTGDSELEALSRELRRGVDGLRLEDSQSPYAAELRVIRLEALSLDASYGGVISDIHQRQSFARLDLRVGNLEHDDSGFFGAYVSVCVSFAVVRS